MKTRIKILLYIFSLILVDFIIGIGIWKSPKFTFKPLDPEYESTDVHIMDGAGVIDDEDSLEEILQEFEDTTGISPYVMTVYDEDWKYYNELWNYAYEIYINSFSDEQHFLIVYSEPENAAELDFVDWSWEGIQGDDTDPILTESKVERFGDDLHDNLLRNNVSVGKAFEYAFEESLTYMFEREDLRLNEIVFMLGIIDFVIIFFSYFFIDIISFMNAKRCRQLSPSKINKSSPVCPKCNMPVSENKNFCKNCGERINTI